VHPANTCKEDGYCSTNKYDLKKEAEMASKVVVRSVLGERFTQTIQTGKHQLFADEPESLDGSDRGPGPYEYLLSALGA
jgi:hypothetical protein